MQDTISLGHPLIKHLVKLRNDRSYRHKEKKTIISGTKIVQEVAVGTVLNTLLVDQNALELSLPAAEKIYRIPFSLLQKITGLPHPQPLAAEVAIPPFSDLTKKRYLLVLDGISDPGNLGTLLRTAMALNWEGVFITQDSADPFNDKALRAARGVTFRLPYAIGSHEELGKLFQIDQMTYYAADIRGESPHGLTLIPPLALILGNEARGPSVFARHRAKNLCIPMNGHVESLNVATAGSILMYLLGSYANSR